jgi:uncharacterized protein YbcI
MPDTKHEDQRERRGEIAAGISTRTVQVLHDYTGRGPTKAHTVINRDSVTVVLQDTLTKGERSLVDAGREQEVLGTRKSYQEMMREDLTALVEQSLQRKVIAFLSDNHADPDIGVEFFLLAPQDGAATRQ